MLELSVFQLVIHQAWDVITEIRILNNTEDVKQFLYFQRQFTPRSPVEYLVSLNPVRLSFKVLPYRGAYQKLVLKVSKTMANMLIELKVFYSIVLSVHVWYNSEHIPSFSEVTSKWLLENCIYEKSDLSMIPNL